MKRLSLNILSIIALAANASAGTIVWNAAANNSLALFETSGASYAPVPAGNLVRLGYFDVGFGDAEIFSNGSSPSGLAVINAAFHELDFDRIGGAEVGNTPGFFAESVNLTDPDGAGLVGKQLYILAYASSNNSTVPLSLSTAFQFGAFYMNKSNASTWGILSDSPITSSATIDLTNLTGPGASDNLVAGGTVVVGRLTAESAGPASARNFALGAVVPEPTSIALIGFTAVGLLSRRRRN